MITEVEYHHPLYPLTPCLTEGHLKVSDLHTLYYATYGNKEGVPVVVLHGGPGAGCQESIVKVFDPERYYVILFDQRGAMRSTPFGSIEENTTQHLIGDIEKIRKHLKIDKWIVFGGSWGSALATLYGQSFPERCLGFVLRGINLLRQEDYLHLMYGMGKIFPDAYEPVIQLIPVGERSDLLRAYHKRVIDPDLKVALPAARAFMRYDLICGTHLPDHAKVEKYLLNEKFVLGVSRMFLHYSVNNFFIKENQILSGMNKIGHLPATIVHGRWDAVCLPVMAYLLHKSWKNSQLWLVTQGGHSSNDPAITPCLATAMDTFPAVRS
jgi:proline iminopeptidase